jgi:N-acetyl sugar amidotransferase
MLYCKRCIIPSTRPQIRLDSEGICNACRLQNRKQETRWPERQEAFKSIVAKVKAQKRPYDCVIPVSGGKDSFWQVITCLKYGLHPLAVTWKTPARTPIGSRNLEALIRLGVDHMDFRINPGVERKFMRRAFARFGSPAIPMHMAIFTIPVNVAIQNRAPLIIWGENSAAEYGGNEEDSALREMNQAWFQKYGVTHGTTAADWVSDDLSAQELTPYFGPSEEVIAQNGLTALFLGSFFPWDTETSLQAALGGGFEVRAEGPKTGYYNYADIDDEFISIHHFMKWYKFGFTRLFDNLSIEIRKGRLDRAQAVEIVRSTGDQTPHEDIEALCRFLQISTREFYDIVERFRNKDVWVQEQGQWKIRDFLIPDWRWS